MDKLGDKGKYFNLIFEEDYTKPITKEQEKEIKDYMTAHYNSLRLQYFNALNAYNSSKL